MGTAVNNLVNSARDWGQKIHPETNQSQGIIKRLVAPRAAMAGTALCNVSQIAKNILHATIQVPGVAAKWVIKPFSCISGSEALKNFENRFPGISDFLKTVARIVQHVLGAAVAGTVGIVYPTAGIKFHDAMGLSYDKRAAAILAETTVPSFPCCVKTEESQTLVPVINTTATEVLVPVSNVVVASTEEEEEEEIAEQSNTAAKEEVVAETVAEAVAEEPAAVVVAETVVEEDPAAVVEEETTDYHYSTSEEDSSSEEAPVAAKGINDYAWSAAATVGNTGQKVVDFFTSTRFFKFATANEV